MMQDNSRYLHTKMLTRREYDSPLLAIRNRHVFDEKRCTTYEWTERDTLDGVAYRFYGISDLRWAILDANPVYRSEFDIRCGDHILIPNIEEVVDLVNV